MKIIVCGIPPTQSRKLESEFPDHDLLVIGAQEREQYYRSHMRPCDLCVVNTRMLSHNKVELIRKVQRDVVWVSGPSAAAAVIRDHVGRAA